MSATIFVLTCVASVAAMVIGTLYWIFKKEQITQIKRVGLENFKYPVKFVRVTTDKLIKMVITLPQNFVVGVYFQEGIRKDGVWGYTNSMIGMMGGKYPCDTRPGIYLKFGLDLIKVVSDVDDMMDCLEKQYHVKIHKDVQLEWNNLKTKIDKSVSNLDVMCREAEKK